MNLETHTDKTLDKVYNALYRTGINHTTATDAIINMQNAGILFRERVEPEERMETEKEEQDCPTHQKHNTML